MIDSDTYCESFFARPTLTVARQLLGTVLHRRLPSGVILHAQITEVEAYTADDPACHAFRGKTPRSCVMFGPPGRAYVYFIYGMYHCLNVVTEPDGVPGAVLIRGLSLAGLDGPGKLCKAWQIDRSLNGMSLMDPCLDLWITPRSNIGRYQIKSSPRIGISKGQEKMWRFYLAKAAGNFSNSKRGG
jgi:DNA-3-methyladenine glycosylase